MTTEADQQIDELIRLHEASWRLGYHAFPAVLNKLGLKRGAEVGVAFGGHSEAILQTTGVEKLYAVDSYQHRSEYDDPMNLPQPVFDRLYQRTGQRLGAFGDRVTQVRLDSVEAARQINEPLRFVYIDGDHSYQGIRADLEAWFPLIREGGIIAGHDYGQPAFPGVKAVADHFFKRFGLSVTHEGKGVWWARRPATPATIVIAASNNEFCDATLYDQLESAGMTKQDNIILVHDEEHPCDAASRVLGTHPNISVQAIAKLRGPWHATTSVLDQITTPMIFPIDASTPLSKGTIQALRDRLCNSGAMAAAYTNGQRTNDFDFTALLTTAAPPITSGQVMMATLAFKHAQSTIPAALCNGSEQLIPWLVLADALATGGRAAIEPCPTAGKPITWAASDCRVSAEFVLQYASLIDGTDLIRLKWPTVASNWLNQLEHKPVRTRANVQPIDTPAVYITPRLMDRVVHKVRRTMIKGAA